LPAILVAHMTGIDSCSACFNNTLGVHQRNRTPFRSSDCIIVLRRRAEYLYCSSLSNTRLLLSASLRMLIGSWLLNPEYSVSFNGAVQLEGIPPAPFLAPRMDPTVAPLQSVSHPPATAAAIPDVKSPRE